MPGKKMSNMGKGSQHYPKEAHEGKQGWQRVGQVGTTKLQEKHTVHAVLMDLQPGEGFTKSV